MIWTQLTDWWPVIQQKNHASQASSRHNTHQSDQGCEMALHIDKKIWIPFIVIPFPDGTAHFIEWYLVLYQIWGL